MKRVLLGATIVSLLVLGSASSGGAATGQHFRAHLTGEAERPAPRDTRAVGQANLRLSEDGTTLVCKLIASNIHNVVQAHIHLGTAEEAGPIVAFLYGPVAAAGGRESGVLSITEITDAEVNGALGVDTVAQLLEQIRAGRAYVNVHTNNGVDPPNEGPGDFPGGEVRGQIALGGPRP